MNKTYKISLHDFCRFIRRGFSLFVIFSLLSLPGERQFTYFKGLNLPGEIRFTHFTGLNLPGEIRFTHFTGLNLNLNLSPLHAGDMDSLRNLYYQSVEDEESLEASLALIDSLRQTGQINEHILTVYEGSLIGLKGKHATSPRKKYRYVMESLPVMEKARKADSTNVEILFIQGTTNYYLPFFFGQSKQAEKNFHEIVRLLPGVYKHYPEDIVTNVLDFLEEHSHLCPEEKDCVDNLRNIIGIEHEE